jgi:hypothetical protein
MFQAARTSSGMTDSWMVGDLISDVSLGQCGLPQHPAAEQLRSRSKLGQARADSF